MFPPGVAMAFEREYGCTEAEWLRDLPAAVAPQALALEPPSGARVTLGSGQLHLQWSCCRRGALHCSTCRACR
jgi:hypothetical protein